MPIISDPLYPPLYSTWADVPQAQEHWRDAPGFEDDTLVHLLIAATEACRAYAKASVWRVLTDGETVLNSTTLSSPLGLFTADDVGRLAIGQGIPSSTTIVDVVDSTTVALDKMATASATGVKVTVLPLSHMLACVAQAREIYAASVREGDVIGVGDFAFRSKPLTGTVKQLLRPQTALGSIG